MSPRIRGPLLSLEAWGTYDKTVTYQRRPTGSVAMKPPRPTGPASYSQEQQRAAFSAAAASWSSQTQETRNSWKAYAVGTYRTGYNHWIRQWLLQRIVSPATPTIPAA